MGNSVHCLILRTTMNNIEMRRIGRFLELLSSDPWLINTQND
jgi:hypothetical protein